MATVENAEYYIIVPKEAVNEVSNPSAEVNTTGYSASGAGVTIARTASQQRRGVYSLQVNPASGVESGVYFGTVSESSGTQKTFSVDVKGVAGQAMRVQIRTTAGVVLSQTAFTANGYWQRIAVSRTGDANTTRRLYVVRDAVASTSPFYVDGLQYETGGESTYLDGDMKGFVRGQVDYRWVGAPHASQSWRSAQTRSGGTMVRIKDFARILAVLGIGMAMVTNIAHPVAGDYSSFQTTRMNDREIVFNLAITGNTPGDIQASRQALIGAVRPDLTARKQPLVVRYQGKDAAGGDSSEPVNIVAHYADGLQDGPVGPGIERTNVRFISYFPYFESTGESGLALGYQTSVANFSNIGYRDVDGTWKAMGTGSSALRVLALATGNDGSVFAGGEFTQMGGVAGTARIARWNGSAWNALGSGASDNRVNALAIGPDGALYAGGWFANMSGVANTPNIAKWNGSAWSALGTGTNDVVFSLAMGPDGTLYAGGWFTLAGGVANTSHIARWNGSAWQALGTGANDIVQALAIGPDGSLYAGGSFTAAGGVAGTAYVARWNGSAWEPLGAGMDNLVSALAFGPDGALYAGGLFTSAGGVAGTAYIAKWNGSAWQPVGEGLNGQVHSLAIGPDGSVYAGGEFTQVNGIPLPDRGAVYQNGTWMPIDVNVQDATADFLVLKTDALGRLYLGGLWLGSTGLSATVTAVNAGGAKAYPVIKFTGPGAVWQVKNYTTGKGIYFKNLTLNAGEEAILDLRPGQVSFTSTFRGSLMGYVLPGSDLDFFLVGGANNLSAFMTGTTAASGITMAWQDLYWSVDGAKR